MNIVADIKPYRVSEYEHCDDDGAERVEAGCERSAAEIYASDFHDGADELYVWVWLPNGERTRYRVYWEPTWFAEKEDIDD